MNSLAIEGSGYVGITTTKKLIVGFEKWVGIL